MISAHNATVAARFARRCDEYDAHAELQASVAAALAEFLPRRALPHVLEVGCGTGLLTRHLLDRYPDGDFLITDLAPRMVEAAWARTAPVNGRAIRFAVMDGEAPETVERFDVIATSMTLQWFADPRAGLARLRALLAPGGALLYATLGPGGFREWRAALAREGLPEGLNEMPALPGVVREERRVTPFGDALSFLQCLKGLGATVPRPGYRPLGPRALRRALARLDAESGASVTWHIVYGRLMGLD